MSLRSESIQRWWPATQSLDLVEGPVEAVAKAVETEVRRFVRGEPVATAWQPFPSLDAAFGMASDFANVPTVYLVLPTRSRWTVLWNNSFLCDGYDSLCWCLTTNHGFTTIHWSAHDDTTTFQPGAAFTYRSSLPSGVIERSVYVGREDRRWLFSESGSPLPEEAVHEYKAKRMRDRLNERLVAELLGRLGAIPWSDDFYATASSPCFVLSRSAAPATITRRKVGDVVRQAG